jgi:hypothetical protein
MPVLRVVCDGAAGDAPLGAQCYATLVFSDIPPNKAMILINEGVLILGDTLLCKEGAQTHSRNFYKTLFCLLRKYDAYFYTIEKSTRIVTYDVSQRIDGQGHRSIHFEIVFEV